MAIAVDDVKKMKVQVLTTCPMKRSPAKGVLVDVTHCAISDSAVEGSYSDALISKIELNKMMTLCSSKC